MKILVVEDDKALNNGIALILGGNEILQAFSLREADACFHDGIDLILLDVNLPDGSGLDFCRKIRGKSRVPIIFLTVNDMEVDIVTGLESGADDYITKPFSLAVLRAKVNAIARRRKENGDVFRVGRFLFDFEAMKFFAGDEAVELSKTEQRLLRLFVENRGRTLRREALLEKVWPDGARYVDENALSVTVRRLRQKLPGLPLKTVYGIGYVWEGGECG